MGIFTDLASTDPIPGKPNNVGLDRASSHQLLNDAHRHDPILRADFTGRDEVTLIPEQTDASTADTYTLTFTFHGRLDGIAPVTTAAIAFDDAASVMEVDVNVAMTAASFPGWTNADISITDVGSLGISDGDVTITFDGASVTEAGITVTLTPTGFTPNGTITRTVEGQQSRKATQALYDMNIVQGTLHNEPDTPAWTIPDSNGRRPRTTLIRDLGQMTLVEDGTESVWNELRRLYPEVK